MTEPKTGPSSPLLLIMDNNLEVIETAKRNNFILFVLLPHTSHKLQPIDRCVYGMLKEYYNKECVNWLVTHPGKRINIYNIAELLIQCYGQAFCAKNVVSVPKCTGIYPLNPKCSSDDEFLPASVTNSTCEISSTSTVTPSGHTISYSVNQLSDEVSQDYDTKLYFLVVLVVVIFLTSTTFLEKLKEESFNVSQLKHKVKRNLSVPETQEDSEDEGNLSFASSTLSEDYNEQENLHD